MQIGAYEMNLTRGKDCPVGRFGGGGGANFEFTKALIALLKARLNLVLQPA